MFKLDIDEDKCTGCSNCVVACPYSASKSRKSGHGFGESTHTMRIINGVVVFEGRCTGCGVCLSVCPTNAIKIVSMQK